MEGFNIIFNTLYNPAMLLYFSFITSIVLEI